MKKRIVLVIGVIMSVVLAITTSPLITGCAPKPAEEP